MNVLRQDLSEWALHFIHDFNPDYEPDGQIVDEDFYQNFPYHEDSEINSRFEMWNISDAESGIGYDSSAFSILLKIVADGHIRASWAFRKNRPTIYGPRAAVCFTEMPLYALVDYAKRRKSDAVGTYAIGVRKNELFKAGGRPVIYGLSGNHTEVRSGSRRSWPRKLDSSCGIAEGEQYRYVAMSMGSGRQIDWSHEREWRWADHDDQMSCPGIPIWLADEAISFSDVFIVVPKSSNVEPVLNLLKELHDSGSNDYFNPFCREALEATSVVALDQLEIELPPERVGNLRLEDIPTSSIQVFKRPAVSAKFVEKVRNVIAEAKEAANEAASTYLKIAPRTKDKRHVADVAGWAHLVVYDSQSPLVSALLELDATYPIPGIGYIISDVGGLGWEKEQALSLAEKAVGGAKAVFEEHFPDIEFGIRTRWD